MIFYRKLKEKKLLRIAELFWETPEDQELHELDPSSKFNIISILICIYFYNSANYFYQRLIFEQNSGCKTSGSLIFSLIIQIIWTTILWHIFSQKRADCEKSYVSQLQTDGPHSRQHRSLTGDSSREQERTDLLWSLLQPSP